MSNINELISQIVSGDNIGARQTFNMLVAEKSMEALEQRKQEIAQTLFQTEAKKEKEEDDEEDEDDEESCEMKTEALANWNDSAGEFTHSKTGKHFTYRKTNDPWAVKHGLTHEIAVGPNAEEKRFANIKGTVAHVAVDENPDGTPDIEKWTIKNHRKHVREDVESLDEISQKTISSYLTKKANRMDKEIESVRAKPQQAFGPNGKPIKGKTFVDPKDKAKETKQIKKIRSNYNSDMVPAVYRKIAFNAGRGDKWWEKKPESEFKGAYKLYHKKGAEYGEAEREEKKQHKANMAALKKKYTEEFEQVDESGGINTAMKQLAYAKQKSTGPDDSAVVHAANKAYHKYKSYKAREKLRTDDSESE